MFANASDEVLTEIIREAETRLAAQLTAAIAADQRAVSFAGLVAIAAAGMVGAGASLLIGDVVRPPLGWGCLISALLLLVSVSLAIQAARPAAFEFGGNTPEQWRSDVESGVPLQAALAEMADHYSGMIAFNSAHMGRSGRLLNAAIWLAWSTVLLTAIGAMGYFALLAI